MKIQKLIALFVFSILASCTTATPYQPATKTGSYDGFSQTNIEKDRVRITFGGNSLTDRETVENYLLFRAAEIALEKNFDHFILVKRDVEEKKRIRTTTSSNSSIYDPYFGYSFFSPNFGWSQRYPYSSFGGFSSARLYGRARFGHRGFGYGSAFRYDPFFDDIEIREIIKYKATAEVVFGEGNKPKDKENAFNASEVHANLKGEIIRPEVK